MLECFITKIVPFNTERFFERAPSRIVFLGGTAHAAKAVLKIGAFHRIDKRIKVRNYLLIMDFQPFAVIRITSLEVMMKIKSGSLK